MKDRAKSGKVVRGTNCISVDFVVGGRLPSWTTFQLEQVCPGVQNVTALVLDLRWDPCMEAATGAASTV